MCPGTKKPGYRIGEKNTIFKYYIFNRFRSVYEMKKSNFINCRRDKHKNFNGRIYLHYLFSLNISDGDVQPKHVKVKAIA